IIWIRCKREHHLVACFVDSEPLDQMTDSSSRHCDRFRFV
ncbi:unnamed protein product, partial [Arabidopsis halleri]